MKIRKALLLSTPIVLMLIWSIAGEFLGQGITNLHLRVSILAVGGLIVGWLMLFILRILSAPKNISLPNLGSLQDFLAGIGIGLLISFSCGILFWFVNQPELHFQSLSDRIFVRFVGNISPAVVEEISFRGAVVHYANIFWGNTIAMSSGSVPFGLIHLMGRLFGQPVDLMQVIGVSLAGLMLSLSYLRFGLVNAIAIHWIWNSIVGFWISLFNLPKNGGVQIFEGAWTTSIVLLVISLMFYFLPKKSSAKAVKIVVTAGNQMD